MPVQAITPDYKGNVLDQRANFGGNQLIYIGWDHHLMFAAPFAYTVSPEITFGQLINESMTATFGVHPEFDQVNWQTAEWLLNGAPFQPQMDVTLIEQGIDHKASLRFHTPELKGFQGSGV